MEIIQHIFLVVGYVAGIGFFLFGLDDLIFDLQFLFYLWRQRKRPHITLKDLRLAPEQWVALFVPAWQEGGVVNKMAEYASRVVSYEKYDIFIGVYPNDPETNRCVDEICAANPRIHKVMVPHPGPTSKADCLNWIYRAARLNEIPGTREYAVAALHDAEDVIHPLALKVYNYFVPQTYDMGQLPVFALELSALKYWVGNCYIDDFAELHTKDMFVRESIGGVVPSAGVGTAFSRAVLEKLATLNNGDPFRVGNVTEDYEIGIRVKRAGFRVGVVSYPVERLVRRPRRDGTLRPPVAVSEVVAIRENFPTQFWTAVRQRSRWILGISFQTWEQTGWAGTWAMRYTLLRDRRAPLTHLVNILGYVALLFALFQMAYRHTTLATDYYLAPLFDSGSLLCKIVIVDTCLLFYRMAQKIISVNSIYNFKQALFSIPRLMISNLINFCATVRAARMYFAHRMFGKPIVWLKTSHVFPGEAELSEHTRSIEDLLVAEGLATREQILQALDRERGASVPLALLRLGLLDEVQFADIWGKFSGLPVTPINPVTIPERLLRQFSELDSQGLEALPLAETDTTVRFASREPLTASQLATLSARLGGRTIQAVLARPSHLNLARTRCYPRLVLPPSRLDATQARLLHSANVAVPDSLEILVNQHATLRSLPDVLLDRGLLEEARARELWAEGLHCASWDLKGFALDQSAYQAAGPAFWWLHRMLPAGGGKIVTAAMPHPDAVTWLAGKLPGQLALLAELPSRLELAARAGGAGLDPDQALVERLVNDGGLKPNAAPNVAELRTLIADPIPKWLLLQKLVTPEQLHRAFAAVARLAPASAWQPDEVYRLRPILPPGFAAANGVYPLAEKAGTLRLGLAQLPSQNALAEIYDRLAAYPLYFEVLSLAETAKLTELYAG